MNEGLRLSFGTLGRHPRIAPDRILQYKDWAIPAGVSTCTTRRVREVLSDSLHRRLAVPLATLFIPTRKYFQTLGPLILIAGSVPLEKEIT